MRKALSDPLQALREFRVEQHFRPPPPYHRDPALRLDFQERVYGKSFVRKLFAQYPQDPFIQKVFEQLQRDLFTLKRENLTYPTIACPGKKALEMHIESYRAKYGIEMHLVELASLAKCLQEVRVSLPRPGYVSFIVGELADDVEDGHVLPLLCSFGPGGMEAIIMDVMGLEEEEEEKMESFVNKVRKVLSPHFMPEACLYIASGGRQSDTSSCRTGALSLLRNAHLSLRFHRCEYGLREPLLSLGSSLSDISRVELPGEWTYVEQIFHGDEKHLVIRDLFSTKAVKRLHPRTVASFRNSHTEEIRFRCTLYNNGKDYRRAFFGLVPPEGVRAVISEEEFSITYELSVQVNTYLLHKGFRRAGLREEVEHGPASQ